MSGQPRRTLKELAVRYRFEPAIRDIFVEGAADCRIARWLISEANLKDVQVYEIGTVEVDPTWMAGRKLYGNRGRLIAFAEQMEKFAPESKACVRVIADADFERIEQTFEPNDMILLTDYSCMEAYWFLPLSVKNLIELYFKKVCYQNFYEKISSVLKAIFFIRYTKERNWHGDKWLDISDSISVTEGLIFFDLNGFCEKLLLKNGKLALKAEFIAEVERVIQIDGDPRNFVNGHDLIHVLGCYGREIDVAATVRSNEALSAVLSLALCNDGCIGGSKLVEKLKSWWVTNSVVKVTQA